MARSEMTWYSFCSYPNFTNSVLKILVATFVV